MIKVIKQYISTLSERIRRSKLPKASQDRYDMVDQLEKEMSQHTQVYCPVEDIFTHGLYTRVATFPTGAKLTSEIHKTEHPFFILKGIVDVANVDTGEIERLTAPHFGITKPYTRRVFNVIEETIWATCHVTKETNVTKIGEKILVQRDNVVPQYKKFKQKTLQS